MTQLFHDDYEISTRRCPYEGDCPRRSNEASILFKLEQGEIEEDKQQFKLSPVKFPRGDYPMYKSSSSGVCPFSKSRPRVEANQSPFFPQLRLNEAHLVQTNTVSPTPDGTPDITKKCEMCQVYIIQKHREQKKDGKTSLSFTPRPPCSASSSSSWACPPSMASRPLRPRCAYAWSSWSWQVSRPRHPPGQP